MQIDREAIDKLLTLNDRQLQSIIQRLVRESGIDPAQFHIDPASVASIRSALSGATDGDIARAGELLKQYKDGKRRG